MNSVESQGWSNQSDDREESAQADNNHTIDTETVRALLAEFEDDLEPMAPAEGVDRYLRSRTDIVDNTRAEYRRKLEFFLEFAELAGIDDLNELSGRDIDEFRTWRREESTNEVDALSAKTMQDDLFLLRDFLEYLESISAVAEGLSDSVRIPDVEDGARDTQLNPERTERIRSYLRKYEYATFDHTSTSLYVASGRRTSGILSLDLVDYHPNADDPYIEFRHRPGETPLKNGKSSEGQVYLPPAVNEVLEDYVETNRYDIVDEYGRRPLLTTKHGRPAKSTLRRIIYRWTRPCQIGRDCPHGKSPDTCRAASNADAASKCDSSRSPHAIRHGYLTELRRKQVPTEVIRDRCDVSEKVLDKHYDERTEEEKRQHRREILEAVRENGGGYL